MAVTHGSTIRDSNCNNTVDALDASSPTAGKFVLLAGGTPLATITLPDPAFATASGGTGNAAGNAIPAAAIAGAAGTADNFRATDGSDVVVFQGTVTEANPGTGDMIITNSSINIGDPVNITSWSYTSAL